MTAEIMHGTQQAQAGVAERFNRIADFRMGLSGRCVGRRELRS
jgi:hypothetical protein